MGAARQADILVGNRSDEDVLLLDVTPLSLGVETFGGLVERIVPRNTTIPVTRAQEFTTARDGQTGLDVHVVQGEREQVQNCRSLARFELKGIPPMVAGAARLRVTFQVDADGLLEVSAQEETTGTTAHVVVKPAFGLQDDQVADMLRASYEFASEDMRARQLVEARTDAQQLIEGVAAALDVDGDLLSDSERALLEQVMSELEAVAKSDNADEIRSATESAGRATEVFATRRMDRSIQAALGGMSLDALDKEFEE
jgi:molecular chaperone HscA